jgi:hypothetical protein
LVRNTLQPESAMLSESFEGNVAALLASMERGRGGFRLEPLSASGNNRVFTLHCDGKMFVLKWYFHDPSDTRDRLGAEYAFLEHAWNMGLRCIPQPLGKDLSTHLAIYEFVEGYKLDASHIDEFAMRQASQFLALLNSPRSRAQASALPNASEACFSLSEHFAMVDLRLSRLANMPVESNADRAATELVSSLAAYWNDTKPHLLRGCNALSLSPDGALPLSERCLSPSDFGFHNALVRPDGSLCFIDFEYAGWDDPSKTVGDFFSHPGVAVPHTHFESFLMQALAPFEGAQQIAARVRLLEPISQVKWCCIILNEFLPVAALRRNFANQGADTQVRKKRQLDKATRFFESLQH